MKAWFGGYLYQRKKGTSEKIPTPILTRFLAIWFTSQRRMRGTRSSQNLMRAHSRLRSIKSVPWAVKKALVLVEDKTRRAQNMSENVKILLSARGAKKQDFEGLLWGQRVQRYSSTYVSGSRPKPSPRTNMRCHRGP